jgi:nitrite reductase/ring-hydroxylating ferredoxin subunit
LICAKLRRDRGIGPSGDRIVNGTSARETVLCEASAMTEGVPQRHERPGGSLIVLRIEGTLHIYANRCPHRGTELDWLPGRFLDPSGRYLHCATHGALFRPDTGECVAGPCRGLALDPVPFTLREGRVVLDTG